MAYIERYVTDAAGGGGIGTEGDPWTLAEALTNAVAGDRVNILSDSGYSLGADSVTNQGTGSQLIAFRGYNSAIGDLENTGWNADGTLDVTGFPVITLTGTLTVPTGDAFLIFQNLVFTGSVANELVGGSAGDEWGAVECKFTNTASNAAVHAFQGDNSIGVVNCDFECTGAAHDVVMDVDSNPFIIGCRIKGRQSGVSLCKHASAAIVINNAFIGTSGNGIGFEVSSSDAPVVFVGNTFYGLETAITYPDSAATTTGILVNNHVTDNGKWIDNLHSATANRIIIEVNNRTRDNTTPRTGVGDGVNVGEVTTDTGGIETDYTDAGSDDFTLIDGAPGKATGVRQFTDIGAYQREEPVGGGGGLLVHPGMEGGVNG